MKKGIDSQGIHNIGRNTVSKLKTNRKGECKQTERGKGVHASGACSC
jgi:hypothetical protein